MPTTYPSASGITSAVTSISLTQDLRNINYDTYNWTPIQQLTNMGIPEQDMPAYLGASKGITKGIMTRALLLGKVVRKRFLRGRDFS